MVVIAVGSDFAGLVDAGLRVIFGEINLSMLILGMVVTMIVVMMSEMFSMSNRIFQRPTNRYRRHIRGIQREH